MTTAKQMTFETEEKKQEFLAAVRTADHNFRIEVKARIATLTSDAGKKALEFVLNPAKGELEGDVQATMARCGAIEDCLGRYISAFRHYIEAETFASTLREILQALESLRDCQVEEAQDHARVTVTNPAKAEQAGSRKLTLNAHNRAQGSSEFVAMLRKAFTPLCIEEQTAARQAA